MAKKKGSREKKQNRPNWRKVRGRGRKLVRDSRGRPVGPRRHRNVNIKTKEWQKVV